MAWLELEPKEPKTQKSRISHRSTWLPPVLKLRVDRQDRQRTAWLGTSAPHQDSTASSHHGEGPRTDTEDGVLVVHRPGLAETAGRVWSKTQMSVVPEDPSPMLRHDGR